MRQEEEQHMKKASVVFFTAVCIIGLAALGQTALSQASHARPSSKSTNTIQQVLIADEARRLATLHGDIAALDALLADDVTIF
jgi:hypothetical protein